MNIKDAQSLQIGNTVQFSYQQFADKNTTKNTTPQILIGKIINKNRSITDDEKYYWFEIIVNDMTYRIPYLSIIQNLNSPFLLSNNRFDLLIIED